MDRKSLLFLPSASRRPTLDVQYVWHGSAGGLDDEWDLSAAGLTLVDGGTYLFVFFERVSSGVSLFIPRVASTTHIEWGSTSGAFSGGQLPPIRTTQYTESPSLFGLEAGFGRYSTGDVVVAFDGLWSHVECLVFRVSGYLPYGIELAASAADGQDAAQVSFPTLPVGQHSYGLYIAGVWPKSIGGGTPPISMPVDFGAAGDDGYLGADSAGSYTPEVVYPADVIGYTWAAAGDGAWTALTLAVVASGPAVAVDQEFTAGALTRSPVLYGPMFQQTDGDDQVILEPAITAEILHRDDMDGWGIPLTGSHGRTWQTVLNEPGAGTVNVDNDDTALDDFDPDTQFIQFALHGWAAQTIRPDSVVRRSIDPGEEHGEITVISGPGHVSILDESLIYPARGLDAAPPEEDRVFNWASPYIDDSGWGLAHVIAQQDADTTYWTGLPGDVDHPWPDPTANWLFSPYATDRWAPEGDCYFRTAFDTTAGQTHVRIFLAADNAAEIWLDGQLVMSAPESYPNQIFSEVFSVDSAGGTHVLAAKCVNGPEPEPIDGDANPAGLLAAVYATNQFGVITDPADQFLTHTDATWLMADCTAGSEPPGITPGRVIRAVIDEAQARGELNGVTLACTDTVDVDGIPWPTVGEIATKTGTDVLTFLRELSGTYIDFWLSPAGLDLWIWGHDNRGNIKPVTLHTPTDVADPNTGNLLELVHTSTRARHTVLLIRYPGGWHEVVDAVQVAALGRRVGLLSLVAPSRAEAERIGAAQLAIWAAPRVEMAAVLEPIDIVPGADLDPFTATDLPYWWFKDGDVITVPDAAGAPTGERVMQLSVSEDDDGLVTFTPVLKDLLLQAAERWEQATKKMVDGTGRGEFKVATPIGRVGGPVVAASCCPPQPVEGGGA